MYVDGGSTITLVCPFKADPANSIRWSGPPNLITLSIGLAINPNLPDAQRSRLSISIGSNGEYNLKISNIQLHDEGVYRCNGVTGGSLVSEDFHLIIKVPITSVILSNQAADENPVKVVNDKNIMFTCKTNAGRPSSKIQWYIASVNITSSASSHTDVCATDCSDDKLISSSQLIYKGKKEDSGKIVYCTALNIQGHGVRSSNKTIDVLCKYF
ncbi:limbic system-associated membrane protein-like [Mytilus trossulus]|uniref:limbic system-associated membrane protein-like n=1 Tax=Mytilus trossulus TaxID=6551 RepID=UPI003003F7AA